MNVAFVPQDKEFMEESDEILSASMAFVGVALTV
jgi:hypothetical protein